jgi:hypothetical protein
MRAVTPRAFYREIWRSAQGRTVHFRAPAANRGAPPSPFAGEGLGERGCIRTSRQQHRVFCPFALLPNSARTPVNPTMTPRQHITLLGQALFGWAIFWVAGLPHYFQQYSTVFLGAGSVILSVLFSLVAVWVLARSRPENRMRRALWISLYFTVPFAILDTLYCGVYLGHGWSYLAKYWYLSVFYVSPWLTFPPTAYLMRDLRFQPQSQPAKTP